MAQDGQVGRDRRGDAADLHLLEGADRAGDRRRAVLAPHDQLADEVVVELADLVAGLVAAVEADAEAVRHLQLADLPGRGQELAAGGVLGVDADLDAVAALQRPHLVLLRLVNDGLSRVSKRFQGVPTKYYIRQY